MTGGVRARRRCPARVYWLPCRALLQGGALCAPFLGKAVGGEYPKILRMTNTEQEVKRVLRDTLQLGTKVDMFTRSTRLLGALPELDSMAVVTVIAGLEETFGFAVADDEISADTFATLDSLCIFVDQKLRS